MDDRDGVGEQRIVQLNQGSIISNLASVSNPLYNIHNRLSYSLPSLLGTESSKEDIEEVNCQVRY